MQRARQTLEDVARTAGVSRSTVSRVVNQQPGVAQAVRDEVWRVVDELGYEPDQTARALASGRADVVDVVVIDDDANALGRNPYYGRVLAGVLDALTRTRVQLRMVLVPRATSDAVLSTPEQVPALGTLLVNVPAALAEKIRRDRGPLVSMGRSAPLIPFIEPENASGIGTAVHHLYGLGRRRIAAIHGPQHNPCGAGRRLGYLAAMREAGLEPIDIAGDFTRETGRRATLDLLAEHPDIDAIVAACDFTAAGALQALAQSGRRVPHDVAVVGFDDSVIAATASTPLTSVHQPVEHIAATATRALLNQHGSNMRTMVATSLTVRASTAG
ncbi:MAG TPA: LacI family DNA-binding transcriptional regulator [Pseudonocardiaceae bacterium]|jgi:DNA-binding LacI/PurR family transcriptional regulator|nr:LacI family DNA-binding transcriptional regulator [Pseudonocardiaceae bacterium]